MSGQASAVGGCGLLEDVSHVLGAAVGDVDTNCVPHLPWRPHGVVLVDAS